MAPQKGCTAMMETSGAVASHTRSSQHPARVSHLNQQPDPRPPTTPSRVGRSPAANNATEPSTMHTHTPLTRTVRITRTRLTRMASSPTGSRTGALTSILSWAPSREAARPPPRPHQRDQNTPRNCSPTRPSPPRAARGARAAAPRATALRSPQKRRTTAVFTVFWPASSVSS